jgi:hypothetical protein
MDPHALSAMVVCVGEERYGNPTFFNDDLKELRATNAEMAGYPWDAAMHVDNRVLIGKGGYPDYFIHYGAWGTFVSERAGKSTAIHFKRLHE